MMKDAPLLRRVSYLAKAKVRMARTVGMAYAQSERGTSRIRVRASDGDLSKSRYDRALVEHRKYNAHDALCAMHATRVISAASEREDLRVRIVCAFLIVSCSQVPSRTRLRGLPMPATSPEGTARSDCPIACTRRTPGSATRRRRFESRRKQEGGGTRTTMYNHHTQVPKTPLPTWHAPVDRAVHGITAQYITCRGCTHK